MSLLFRPLCRASQRSMSTQLVQTLREQPSYLLARDVLRHERLTTEEVDELVNTLSTKTPTPPVPTAERARLYDLYLRKCRWSPSLYTLMTVLADTKDVFKVAKSLRHLPKKEDQGRLLHHMAALYGGSAESVHYLLGKLDAAIPHYVANHLHNPRLFGPLVQRYIQVNRCDAAFLWLQACRRKYGWAVIPDVYLSYLLEGALRDQDFVFAVGLLSQHEGLRVTQTHCHALCRVLRGREAMLAHEHRRELSELLALIADRADFTDAVVQAEAISPIISLSLCLNEQMLLHEKILPRVRHLCSIFRGYAEVGRLDALLDDLARLHKMQFTERPSWRDMIQALSSGLHNERDVTRVLPLLFTHGTPCTLTASELQSLLPHLSQSHLATVAQLLHDGQQEDVESLLS